MMKLRLLSVACLCLVMLEAVAQVKIDQGSPVAGSPGPFTVENIEINTIGAIRKKDNKDIRVNLSMTNRNEHPLLVIFVQPQPSLIDNRGNVLYGQDSVGVRACHQDMNKKNWNYVAVNCLNYYRDHYTTLQPNSRQTVLLRFNADASPLGDESMDGDTASLTAQLHVIGSDKDQSKIVSISIPDIPLN